MKLLSITAELQVFDGRTIWEEPLRLGVSIEGRDFIRVCEQWGDSISFDDHPLTCADLGEGAWVEVHDITDRLGPGLRGSEIEAVRPVRADGDRLVGLALTRRDAPAFCIWINDDEFHWGDEEALRAGALGGGGVVIGEG